MEASASLAKAFFQHTHDKRIEVLRLIAGTGSISQAAREAGVSYKAAWQAIDTLTNLTGVSLVEKSVGGVGGGGAVLTEAGERLLEIAEKLSQQRERLLAEFSGRQGIGLQADLYPLAIQTSMRNYLPCQVKAIKLTGPIVRVILKMRNDALLVARITRTSTELLGLKAGLPVTALCKATAVRIERETARADAGNFNLLYGTVTRSSRGDEADELGLELESGLQLVGFADASLKINEGERVLAMVDESAVVVAIA